MCYWSDPWPHGRDNCKTWVKPLLLCCCNSADVTTVSFHFQHLELILGPCVKLSHWLTVRTSLVTYIPQRITSGAFSSLWSTLATFPAVSDHQFFRTSSLSVTNEDAVIRLNIMCPFLIPEVVCCGQLGCVCFLNAWTQPQLDFGCKLLISHSSDADDSSWGWFRFLSPFNCFKFRQNKMMRMSPWTGRLVRNNSIPKTAVGKAEKGSSR